MKTMPLKLRHDDETPARPQGALRLAKPELAEVGPMLQLAPEATAESHVKASATPTFAKMGRALVRPFRKRPKLTRKNAAIMLGVSTLVGMRYIDANVEPNWPTYAPSYPKAMVGPNAASFYHAAIESLRYNPAVRSHNAALGKLHPSDKRLRTAWYDLSDNAAPLELKRAAMLDNADALKWLHEAGTKNYYGNFDGSWLKTHDFVAPTLSSPVPNFVAMRELARTAAGSCDVLAAEGKHAEAFDRALDVAKWGIDLTHDPTLIQAMIGLLIQGIGQEKAAELLANLSPEDAKVALARLESLPPPATFFQIVRGEEAFGVGMFRDLAKAGDITPLASANSPNSSVLGAIAGRAMYDGAIMFYTKRGIVENYTNVFDEYARHSAIPYREAKAPMERFAEKVERGEGLNYFTRIAVPNANRARWAFEARVAGREIIRTQLALKVYQSRHGGKLPASLGELSSEKILGQVPTDPFSTRAAEPLQYDQATGKVWSVGSDGIDQRGEGDDNLRNQ